MRSLEISKRSRSLLLLVCLCSNLQGCFLFLPFVDTNRPDPEEERIAAARARYTQQSIPGVRQAERSTSPTSMVNRYIRELGDKSATKRTSAASYLGMMGERAAPAVPALIQALHDPERFVRRAAARSLGKIGAPALGAKDALRQAAKDKDEYVAHTAKLALDKLARVSG